MRQFIANSRLSLEVVWQWETVDEHIAPNDTSADALSENIEEDNLRISCYVQIQHQSGYLLLYTYPLTIMMVRHRYIDPPVDPGQYQAATVPATRDLGEMAPNSQPQMIWDDQLYDLSFPYLVVLSQYAIQ